jgi:hypothetical protein
MIGRHAPRREFDRQHGQDPGQRRPETRREFVDGEDEKAERSVQYCTAGFSM